MQTHSPRNLTKKRSGVFFNLLSGIFVTGSIAVVLLFVIIFINPQTSFNPLLPNTLPAQVLTYTPSSTPKPVFPSTWTPTASPTNTPTLTPIPTDTPMPTVDYTLTSEADTVHTDADCIWLEDEGLIYDKDGLPVTTQLAPLESQTQDGTALPAPLSTDDGISDLFTPEIQYWEDEILDWGEVYGLDPNLIATVMLLESCGYVKALSAAGAKGLFQVMPQYFEEEEHPYDPDTNAYRGLSWLKRSLIIGGSTKMALAGYNAGFTRLNNPFLEWPNETQRYVNWGLNIYRDAKCGYDSSSALDHWLSKGGAALCSRAAAEQQDN